MWFCVYDVATGTPLSIGESVAAEVLEDPTRAVAERATAPDMFREQWNVSTRAWETKSLNTSMKISRKIFMERIGVECRVAVQIASQGTTPLAAALRDWLLLFQVVDDVDLTDPATAAGVDNLIAAGLLAAERRPVVFAPNFVP